MLPVSFTALPPLSLKAKVSSPAPPFMLRVVLAMTLKVLPTEPACKVPMFEKDMVSVPSV